MILAVAKYADTSTLMSLQSRTFSSYWGDYKSPQITETFQLGWNPSQTQTEIELGEEYYRRICVWFRSLIWISSLTLMKFSIITYLREFYYMTEERKQNQTPNPDLESGKPQIRTNYTSIPKLWNILTLLKSIKGTINSVLWKFLRAPLPRRETLTYKEYILPKIKEKNLIL